MPVLPPITRCESCPVAQAIPSGSCPFVRAEMRARSSRSEFLASSRPVFFVKSGILIVLNRGESGLFADETYYGPGSIIGWHLLRCAEITPSVRAVTEAEICEIDLPGFRRFASEHPAVLLSLALDEIRSHERRTSYRLGPAKTRVARLLAARERHGSRMFPLLICGRDLARITDLRPETISRILAHFRHKGILEKGPGLFVRRSESLNPYVGSKE